MKSITYVLYSFCLFFSFLFSTNAQADSSSIAPILFIYDASGSMWGKLEGKTKKEIAASVFSNTINQLPADQKIGLMAYGHRKKGDCEDVELMINMNNLSKESLIQAINGISPLGKTPLAKSAQMAIDNLSSSKSRATIILVTDGIESCNGDLCLVVTKAKEAGINFKLHIVGFGLKEGEAEALKCAAQMGGGRYYGAEDAGDLGDVLTEATAATVDEPKENVSIYTAKNNEAIDSWIRAYRKGETEETGHAARTYQDTARLYLPPGTYDLKIQPLENTDLPASTISVVIKEGEAMHRDISFDAAQLEVYGSNNQEGCDALVKVLDLETGKTVASTRTYGKTQLLEVPPGLYKVSFKAIRALGDQKAKINGNAKEVEVIQDSIVLQGGVLQQASQNFETGIVKIGAKNGSGELVDAVIKIRDVSVKKQVTGSRTYTDESSNPRLFILTTGTYEAEVYPVKQKGTSQKINIVVKTGETIIKNLTF